MIAFTILPPSSWTNCRSANAVPQRAFELDAEEFELTGGGSEPLRVGHQAATVKQRQDSVFRIQQRIDLLVNLLHITAERLSKSHHYRSVSDIEAPSARDRRNVSSLAREPKSADAFVHRSLASMCGQSSSQSSAAGAARRRRSWVTIASCHATSRARSAAVSAVPLAKSAIAYGFMIDLL
jgi:hypothetical protein